MSTLPVSSILQGVDYREVADLAGIAYHVLQNNISKDEHEAGLSVHDINNFLKALAEANIFGKRRREKRYVLDFALNV